MHTTTARGIPIAQGNGAVWTVTEFGYGRKSPGHSGVGNFLGTRLFGGAGQRFVCAMPQRAGNLRAQVLLRIQCGVLGVVHGTVISTKHGQGSGRMISTPPRGTVHSSGQIFHASS